MSVYSCGYCAESTACKFSSCVPEDECISDGLCLRPTTSGTLEYNECETDCSGLLACSLGTHSCDDAATCETNSWSYSCTCGPGYTGDGLGSDGCNDINECTLETHNCNINAKCTNTLGSFSCTCQDNYYGDGLLRCDYTECLDGLKGGDEVGYDCGGSCASPCTICPTPSDGSGVSVSVSDDRGFAGGETATFTCLVAGRVPTFSYSYCVRTSRGAYWIPSNSPKCQTSCPVLDYTLEVPVLDSTGALVTTGSTQLWLSQDGTACIADYMPPQLVCPADIELNIEDAYGYAFVPRENMVIFYADETNVTVSVSVGGAAYVSWDMDTVCVVSKAQTLDATLANPTDAIYCASFRSGVHTTTFFASDSSGKTSSCNQKVTVYPPSTVNINECQTGLHKCGAEAQCLEINGDYPSYECLCTNNLTSIVVSGEPVYRCSIDYTKFTAGEDECTEKGHQCDPNASCIDIDIGYDCECNSGYSGDGLDCAFNPYATIFDSIPTQLTGLSSLDGEGFARVFNASLGVAATAGQNFSTEDMKNMIVQISKGFLAQETFLKSQMPSVIANATSLQMSLIPLKNMASLARSQLQMFEDVVKVSLPNQPDVLHDYMIYIMDAAAAAGFTCHISTSFNNGTAEGDAELVNHNNAIVSLTAIVNFINTQIDAETDGLVSFAVNVPRNAYVTTWSPRPHVPSWYLIDEPYEVPPSSTLLYGQALAATSYQQMIESLARMIAITVKPGQVVTHRTSKATIYFKGAETIFLPTKMVSAGYGVTFPPLRDLTSKQMSINSCHGVGVMIVYSENFLDNGLTSPNFISHMFIQIPCNDRPADTSNLYVPRGYNVTFEIPVASSSLFIQADDDDAQCTWWNRDLSMWDMDGCVKRTSSNSTHLHCSCSHLTEFSVMKWYMNDYNDRNFSYRLMHLTLNSNNSLFWLMLIIICVLVTITLTAVCLDTLNFSKQIVKPYHLRNSAYLDEDVTRSIYLNDYAVLQTMFRSPRKSEDKTANMNALRSTWVRYRDRLANYRTVINYEQERRTAQSLDDESERKLMSQLDAEEAADDDEDPTWAAATNAVQSKGHLFVDVDEQIEDLEEKYLRRKREREIERRRRALDFARRREERDRFIPPYIHPIIEMLFHLKDLRYYKTRLMPELTEFVKRVLDGEMDAVEVSLEAEDPQMKILRIKREREHIKREVATAVRARVAKDLSKSLNPHALGAADEEYSAIERLRPNQVFKGDEEDRHEFKRQDEIRVRKAMDDAAEAAILELEIKWEAEESQEKMKRVENLQEVHDKVMDGEVDMLTIARAMLLMKLEKHRMKILNATCIIQRCFRVKKARVDGVKILDTLKIEHEKELEKQRIREAKLKRIEEERIKREMSYKQSIAHSRLAVVDKMRQAQLHAEGLDDIEKEKLSAARVHAQNLADIQTAFFKQHQQQQNTDHLNRSDVRLHDMNSTLNNTKKLNESPNFTMTSDSTFHETISSNNAPPRQTSPPLKSKSEGHEDWFLSYNRKRLDRLDEDEDSSLLGFADEDRHDDFDFEEADLLHSPSFKNPTSNHNAASPPTMMLSPRNKFDFNAASPRKAIRSMTTGTIGDGAGPSSQRKQISIKPLVPTEKRIQMLTSLLQMEPDFLPDDIDSSMLSGSHPHEVDATTANPQHDDLDKMDRINKARELEDARNAAIRKTRAEDLRIAKKQEQLAKTHSAPRKIPNLALDSYARRLLAFNNMGKWQTCLIRSVFSEHPIMSIFSPYPKEWGASSLSQTGFLPRALMFSMETLSLAAIIMCYYCIVGSSYLDTGFAYTNVGHWMGIWSEQYGTYATLKMLGGAAAGAIFFWPFPYLISFHLLRTDTPNLLKRFINDTHTIIVHATKISGAVLGTVMPWDEQLRWGQKVVRRYRIVIFIFFILTSLSMLGVLILSCVIGYNMHTDQRLREVGECFCCYGYFLLLYWGLIPLCRIPYVTYASYTTIKNLSISANHKLLLWRPEILYPSLENVNDAQFSIFRPDDAMLLYSARAGETRASSMAAALHMAQLRAEMDGNTNIMNKLAAVTAQNRLRKEHLELEMDANELKRLGHVNARKFADDESPLL